LRPLLESTACQAITYAVEALRRQGPTPGQRFSRGDLSGSLLNCQLSSRTGWWMGDARPSSSLNGRGRRDAANGSQSVGRRDRRVSGENGVRTQVFSKNLGSWFPCAGPPPLGNGYGDSSQVFAQGDGGRVKSWPTIRRMSTSLFRLGLRRMFSGVTLNSTARLWMVYSLPV
jgi:hypothetical protein